MNPVAIDPAVALAETQHLCDFYRNRSMVQAQAIAELRAENSALRAALAEQLPEDAQEVADAA